MDDFLQRYRERAQGYPKPSVTVDLTIFTVKEATLEVLLIQRGEPPFEGAWALPGGFVGVGDGIVERGESLEQAARRELNEETNLDLSTAWLEQVGAFGSPDRDPRMRVISVAYTALIPPDRAVGVRGGSDAAAAAWWAVDAAPALAFDHPLILEAARAHVQRRLTESAIGFALVPTLFTIAELRDAWTAVSGTPTDPGNFRRRFRGMLDEGIVRDTGKKRRTPTKPATLYTFDPQPQR